jgi:hypothetical protein
LLRTQLPRNAKFSTRSSGIHTLNSREPEAIPGYKANLYKMKRARMGRQPRKLIADYARMMFALAAICCIAMEIHGLHRVFGERPFQGRSRKHHGPKEGCPMPVLRGRQESKHPDADQLGGTKQLQCTCKCTNIC